jgi:ribosome-interacting GTPase 1
MPCVYVLNKIDAITIQELDLLDRVPHYVPISAKDEWNFDELLEKIWEYAKMIRMYAGTLRRRRRGAVDAHVCTCACACACVRVLVSWCWWRCCSYTKPRGQIPDYNAPVVLHSASPTVADLCDRIHKSLLRNLK